MKNLIRSFLLLSVLFFPFSCKENNDNPGILQIEFVSDNLSVSKDTLMSGGTNFKVSIKAAKGASDLQEFSIVQNDLPLQGYPKLLNSTQKDSFSEEISLTSPFVAGSYIYKFIIKDVSNQEAVVQFTLQVQTSSLLTNLQKGGYILYFRHMAADVGTDITNASGEWWKSCSSTLARQLNAKGRSDSQLVGREMAERNIPIGRVISSEFCRCFESANLLLDFLPNKNSLVLEYSKYLTYLQPEFNTTGPLNLLKEVPAAGTNTILMSHLLLSDSSSQIPQGTQLNWGDALLFKSNGNGNYSFITFIRIGDWEGMK